jgi:hypothetical protein
MPPIEDLLRVELRRVTDAVQPGQLRPLRVPAPGPRWRPRLLAAVACAAVVAIAVVAALLVGTSARPLPYAAPAPSSMPRFYVTAVRTASGLEAVVRDSASGLVTGTTPLPDTGAAWGVSVTTSPAERTFVIAAVLNTSSLPGTDWTLFFRLSVSPAGRPGAAAKLNVSTDAMPLAGMALSPDGTRLALSFEHEGIIVGTQTYGVVQVIDLATGRARTWTGHSSQGYWAGTPSWGTDDRTLAFPWWHITSATGTAVITGVRQLDTSRPGGNLLESQLTGFPAAVSGIHSAVIASSGREIIAAACHDTSPPGHSRGRVTARIIELSAADGRLLRVLRTQSARYTNLGEQDYLDGGCAVLSADPSGNHALVQDFQFGRIDNGVFTAMPGAGAGVTFVAAGW